jgi:DNA-binding CsgD family transcriptional regulator
VPLPGVHQFVGRADELGLLERCLAQVLAGHPQLVWVEGAAGIGKTSLVRRFLAGKATAALWSSGDENEVELAWGVLGQLATSAAAQGLPALAELVVGLDPQADPLFVGAGLLRLIGQRPLVVVVDDLHWADRQSLNAARFAFRRLVSEPVLAVVTSRPEAAGQLGEAWRRLLHDEGRAKHVRLGGLAPQELSELAQAMCGWSLSRRAAKRLEEQTEGHPLFARSLLEQLPLSAIERSDGPLPAPLDVASAVSAQLASCRPATRELVCLAAVVGRPARTADLARACKLPGFADALEEAVAKGLLAEMTGTAGAEIGPAHALVRSAVYHDLSPRRRQELHLQLASALPAPAGLPHRAAAATAPDPQLASELEAAGHANMDLGRLSQGAKELKRSLELTGPGPQRRPRLLRIAEALLVGGDAAGAKELEGELSGLSEDAWSSYVRGYLALLQAKVAIAERLFGHAWGALQQGPAPEGAPNDLPARVASQLAIIGIVRLDYEAMVRFGDAAVSAGSPEAWVRQFAWFAKLVGLCLAGRSDDALRLLEKLDQPGGPGGVEALVARGMARLWADDLDGAEQDLTVAVERGESGEPVRVSQALGYLGEAVYRRGRLDEAVVHCELAVEQATEAGRVWDLPILHALACYPRAARGDLEEAAAHARQSAEWAAVMGTASARAYAASARASLARARDDAIGFCEAARELSTAYEAREPGAHLLGPALAEALVVLGRVEEAAGELALFDQKTAPAARSSAQLASARVHGMVAAARGDWAAAQASFEQAVTSANQLGMPLEAALSLLAWGRAAKQVGERRAALRHLMEARALFSALSAGAYTHIAARLLEELGTAEDDLARPATAGLLTPTEGAVARLVASRLTNAEVASRLMVSEKTVEYHLTHIYAKLGAKGRRELASRLGTT